MADLKTVEAAFLKAHAAGDVENAKVLAGEVLRLRAGSPETPKTPPVERFTPSGEQDYETPGISEHLLNPGVTHALISAGRGMADIYQGLHQGHLMFKDKITGGKEAEAYTASRTNEADTYAKDHEGFDPGRLAGNLAITAPANAIVGPGGAGLKAIAGRSAVGAGVGGATGAAMFAPSDTTKEDNAAAGAAIGAAIPPAAAILGKVGGIAYHGLIEPWLNPAAIKGRAYLEAAGGKVKEIIDQLTANKQLVPGSAPTAGEAAVPAGRAEFSALQQSASKVKPSEYLARNDEQNAARVGAIEEFAGNPAKRAEATAAREAAAGPLYEAGGKAKLPFPAETANVTEFKQLLNKPSVKAAVSRAEKLVEEQTGKRPNLEAATRTGKLTGDDAQKIKLAFDDLIRVYPKSAADTAELQAIKDSRGEFLKWMEGQFPDLKQARAVYKETSAPINQMDVGRELEQKLTPALREDGKLRAAPFAGAVRESASTIKKATGEPRFQNLEDILTSRQLQATHGVQDDLARADRHMEMARRGAQAGPNALDLATANLEREVGGKLPNMLHRGVMLANAIITRMEGGVNKKLAAEMAVEMLNPPKVGEALAAAQAREARNKLIAEQMRRLQNPVIAGTVAGVTQPGGQ